MKKTVLKLLSFILMLASLLTMSSCKKGFKSELGLNFKISSDMEKVNAYNSDIFYKNADVSFFATVVSREALENPVVTTPDPWDQDSYDPNPWIPDPDSTVTEYTEGFIDANDYDTEYEYDSKSNKASFWIDVENEGVSCYFVITRNKKCIYIVGMECDTAKKDEFASVFEQWGKDLYID